MNTVKKIFLVSIILLIWTAFIGLGFIEGYLLRPFTNDQSAEGFTTACKEKIESEYVGNLALLMIQDGEVAANYFYSDNNTVDKHSAFPVASISKWVTAFGVLKLVEEGKLELDAPVESYLTRWHLPKSEFDNSKVTARRLLSHSAGFTDDLGYAGFTIEEEVQSLEGSLDKAADGYYSEGKAEVGYEPGSEFMYSGASYTLLQLLIEEISGQSFTDYMQSQVLRPLGMANSSFELADSSKIGLAPVFRTDGITRPMNRFTAKAAASLMTSAADITKFMQAHVSDNSFINSKTIKEMSSPNSYRNGIAYYGLGPKLFSQNRTDSKIIGHDGSGNDAINTAARIDLLSKNGIIIFETGNYSFASDLADEWMFWQAGIADRVVMERNIPFLLTLLIIGYILIITCATVLIKRHSRSK